MKRPRGRRGEISTLAGFNQVLQREPGRAAAPPWTLPGWTFWVSEPFWSCPPGKTSREQRRDQHTLGGLHQGLQRGSGLATAPPRALLGWTFWGSDPFSSLRLGRPRGSSGEISNLWGLHQGLQRGTGHLLGLSLDLLGVRTWEDLAGRSLKDPPTPPRCLRRNVSCFV